jgi:hypothetical protein
MTLLLPDTIPSEQLLAIQHKLDAALAACRRIATGSAEFCDRQRARATRCDELVERLRKLEVLP